MNMSWLKNIVILTLHVVAQAPEVPQLGPEPKGEGVDLIFWILHHQLPIQSYFGSPTWLHRLQRSPNLALNPMERLETMIIEFYALKNNNRHETGTLLSFFEEMSTRTRRRTQSAHRPAGFAAGKKCPQ